MLTNHPDVSPVTEVTPVPAASTSGLEKDVYNLYKGRNLFLNSAQRACMNGSSIWYFQRAENPELRPLPFSFSALLGKKVTLSFDVEIKDIDHSLLAGKNVGVQLYALYNDGSYMPVIIKITDTSYTGSSYSAHLSQTFTIPDKELKPTAVEANEFVAIINELYGSVSGTIKMFNIKIEIGEEETPWSMAPEDISTEIQTSEINFKSFDAKSGLKITGENISDLDWAKQQTIKWIGTPDANFSAIGEKTAIVANQRDITTSATLLSDVFTLIGNSQLEFLLDYACDVTIEPNTTSSGGLIIPIGEPTRVPLCKVEALRTDNNSVVSALEYTDLSCTGKKISLSLPAGSYRFRITTINRIYYEAGITRLPDTMTARATCRAYINKGNTAYQGKITNYDIYHVIGRNGMASVWNEEKYFYMSPGSADLLRTRGNAELLSPDGRYGLQVTNNGVKMISAGQECFPAPVLCGGNVGVTGGKGNIIGYLNFTPTTDSSTGITRIQHNYGSSNYVVIATVNGEVPVGTDNIITVISKTDNYFEVLGKNCTSGINENTPFYFVMFKAN